jgi:hypothetical protein
LTNRIEYGIISYNIKEVITMTNEQKDIILGYVAQEILSPLATDDRTASEVWEELIGDPFNKLCRLVCDMVKEG